MPLTVNIQLDVPPLSDTDVWFANAAAWTEYWANINVEAEFDAIDNTIYVPSTFNYALLSPSIVADDGATYSFCTQQQLESVLTKLNTLDANYQTLRNELKVAGLLENSQ